MSTEEFDRRITFIVEQQAQFAADMQQLRHSQAQTDQVVAQTGEIVAQTGEIVAQTGEIVGRLAHVTLVGFKDVNAKIDALIDAQIRNEENTARGEERITRTEESISRTEKSVARTTETVRRLAEVVERHIRGGRNGRRRSSKDEPGSSN